MGLAAQLHSAFLVLLRVVFGEEDVSSAPTILPGVVLGVLSHLMTCVLSVESFTEHVATTAWLSALTILVAPSKSTFVLGVRR